MKNSRAVQELIKNYLKALDPRNYFRILFVERMLVIKYYNRGERVDALEQKLINDRLELVNTRTYIKHVLDEVLKPLSGCDYVIFQIGDNAKQFVQFWTGDKMLEHDFPFVSGNDHLPYMKQTRKLLEQLGLSFSDSGIEPMQYCYNLHVPEDTDDYSTLNAHFGKDTDIAAEYTEDVFTKVFNKNMDDLTIQLGTQKNNFEKKVEIGKIFLSHIFSRVKKRKHENIRQSS